MERMLDSYAGWIVRHNLLALSLGVVLTVLSAVVTTGLRFDTGFAALLPPDNDAVLQVERVKEKAGGTVDLIIALESLGHIDAERRLRFARRIVERLEREPWIRRADAEYPVDFFLERRLLFLEIDELEELQEAVEDDVNRAKATAGNPLFVNLQEEDEAPWSNTEDVLEKAKANQHTDGVLQRDLRSKDNRYAFVRVKPMGTSFDMAEGAETLRKVDAIVQSLDPDAENLGIRYSGAMPVNQEQHRTMTTDLGQASLLALVLVLLLLTLFTGQPGAPVIIAGPLVMGISATLAVTTVSIGQLNLVSGFLITALVGVGVDYGIHLFLRYLEALRTDPDRRAAMILAIRFTFPGCLTSGLTTFAAFLAMTGSDFRGFQEYGQIAATGVALTLTSTFLLMPPLALLLTRRPGQASAFRSTPMFPLQYAWGVVVLGIAFTAYAIPAGFQIRYHNEFKKELRGFSEASEFQSTVVEEALGGSLNPAVVAVANLDEARKVEALVQASIAEEDSEFARVLSLASLVPENLDERAELVAEIREEIESIPLDRLSEDEKRQLDEYLTLTKVKPWQVDDIPENIQRLLYAIDRSMMFVLIWPSGEMAEDIQIIAWAKALDKLQADLETAGLIVPVLDENRIAARVLAQIRRDGPWAVLYGFVAVLALLILDFRNLRRVVLVAGSLVVGFIWMFGFMYAFGFKVNVFNMAVFPTVLGIGIDNAVHLMHRYDQEGRGSVFKVLFTTGSAAVLASVTTGIGFASTLIAHHNGIKSMGQLAVVGFAGSLLASTVLFPAVLRVLEGRTTEKEAGDS